MWPKILQYSNDKQKMLRSRRVIQKVNQLVLKKPIFIVQQPVIRLFSEKNDNGPTPPPKGEEMAAQDPPSKEVPAEQAVVGESPAEAAPVETVNANPAEEAQEEAQTKQQKVPKKGKKQQASTQKKAPAMRHGYSEKQIINAKLQDHRALELNEYMYAQKAVPIMQIDVSKAKNELKSQIQKEKTEFLEKLNAQEKLIKKDANMRVFSTIDELAAIHAEENALLDQAEPTSSEEKFLQDQKRKELLVRQVNLKPSHSMPELSSLVDKFPNLRESQKRDTFVSLSMALKREQAKAELYSNESGSTSQMEDALSRAQKYQDLLKTIMPREKTFDSLAEIQSKKANIDKIFDDATQQVEDRMAKIEEVQAQLKTLDSKVATEQFYRGLIEQKLMSQNQFNQKSKQVQEYKNAIEGFPEEEISVIRDRKKSNIQAQNKAEYEAQQMRNLMLLISKSQNDLGHRMRQIQYNHNKREEFLKDKSNEQDAKMKIKFDGHSKIDHHKDFLAKLKQYDVDPVWLKNQQYSLLNEKMLKEDQDIFDQASEIEQQILMKEGKNLLSMINSKAETQELKSYLLGQLRSQSFLEGVENNAVNQLIMGSLEARINGNQDFYPTGLLMELISREQTQKVAKPSRSVFDEADKDTKKWMPSNELDIQYNYEALSYENYKYRQLEELKDLENQQEDQSRMDEATIRLRDFTLMDQMSNIKRDAWLYIYNTWIQKGQKEQGIEFLELFRDAQNKLPEVVNKDYIQMLSTDYAKVYDPESMSTEELRKEEMRQAIIETQEQMDKDLKDALGADFETKIGTLSQQAQDTIGENQKIIQEAKEQFKTEFGHDVSEGGKIKLENYVFEGVGIIPEMKDGRLVYNQIPDMQFLSDQLVRKITNHLRDPSIRISRISDQIGVSEADNIYNSQVFDSAAFESLQEFEALSDQEQQNILQKKLQQKQDSIQRSLEMRNTRLEQLLGKESKKEEKDSESIEDVNEQLDQVESKVRQRIADEEQGKLSNDPIQQVIRKIGAEARLISQLGSSGPLREYIEQDKFGVHNQEETEEAKIQELVSGNKDFDLAFIVGSKQAKELMYTGVAGVDTASQMTSAQSSAQIKEAGATQRLSASDQRLASIYDPSNKTREQYLRQRYQYHVNLKIKEQFAQQILMAQEFLEKVNYQRERFMVSSEHKAKQFSSEVPPMKVFDFVKQEIKNSRPVNKSAMIVDRLEKFNPKSTNISNYNDELRLQLELNGKDFNTQFNYVLQQMKANGVSPDCQTRALLFSKNMKDQDLDQATINLKKLVDSRVVYSHSPVKVSDLNQFFEKSLAKDNFDGLAHLASYIERYQVDISKWEVSRFRSAIDFYLNHSFDINKILTFSRYYMMFAKSKLQSSGEFQDVFGDLEALVDMNALFGYLVEKVGTKTFIDPQTKEDPIQNLMEFFAQKEVQDISKMSQEGTTFISSGDIVKYLSNHLDSAGSFKKTADVILKYQDSQPQISSLVIQKLRQYSALQKGLPSSFTEQNIRKLYLDIKSSEFELEEKSAEFLLFLFKSKGMFAESIDLCQNYHTLVKGYDSEQSASMSDIRNYYMSDSLMDLPLANSDNHYYQLLEQAVFNSESASPAYLTSMTKAYFKDGSVDHALKFFHDGVSKRQEMTQKQEETLVSMYDETFANSSISEQAFKEKYLSIMIAREKLKKEVKTANLIQSILQRCEPEEIEQVFALQIVLKEERSLLAQIANINGVDYELVYSQYDKSKNIDSFFKDFGNKNEKAQNELKTVRSRKQALQSSINHHNVSDLLSALKIQDGQEVELFGESQSLDEALTKLGVSPEEYAAYKQYDQKESLISSIIEDLNASEIDRIEKNCKAQLFAFQKVLDKTIEREITKKDKELEMFDTPDIPAVDMLEEFEEEYGVDVEQMIDNANLDPDGKADENELPYIQAYKKFIYEEEPEAEYENLVIKENVFNELVEDTSDYLVESVAARREKTLGFAIKTFNKIQSSKAPVFYDLNLKPEVENNEVKFKLRDTQEISKTLDRYHYLLHDQNSPIISNFLSLGDSIESDTEKMESLMDQLNQMGSGMESMNVEIQSQVNKHMQAIDENKRARHSKIQKMVDQKIHDTYQSFKQTQTGLNYDESASAESLYPTTLSREQKVSVMKQCLQLEGFKPIEVLDNFYTQDLIIFGMQNNIPEAVRLGEKVLGETNQTLPLELAKAVKSYKLSNNARYQNAIKTTGPINTGSVYRSSNDKSAALFNRDDPYLQNLIEKNYRVQDHYKVPSALAWDHKEHGLIGEIVDMKKLERNAQQFNKFN